MLYKKFLRVHSLDEAMSCLNTPADEKVRLLAGGTDLMLQLQERQTIADVLVDISQVPELRGVRLDAGKVIIGAATPYSEIARSPIILQYAYMLSEASRRIGAAQIQNMATLGGNIGNASPAADAIPCLYALDAELVVKSLAGERVIPIGRFHQGYRKIDLNHDELISEIRFNVNSEEKGTAFYKYSLRKSQAISIVNAAAVLTIKNGQIDHAAVALGAVAPTVIRCRKAEAALVGQVPSLALFETAGDLARSEAQPIDDIRGSASFRSYLVGVCVRQVLQMALERAKVLE